MLCAAQDSNVCRLSHRTQQIVSAFLYWCVVQLTPSNWRPPKGGAASFLCVRLSSVVGKGDPFWRDHPFENARSAGAHCVGFGWPGARPVFFKFMLHRQRGRQLQPCVRHVNVAFAFKGALLSGEIHTGIHPPQRVQNRLRLACREHRIEVAGPDF